MIIRRAVLLPGLVVSILVAARPASAQDGYSNLRVCNKGRVVVEVVTAYRGGAFGERWEFVGTSFAPGECGLAYRDVGNRQELFLGFGFKNARGQFISGSVSRVPDLGRYDYRDIASIAIEGTTGQTVLTRMSPKAICVHADQTFWGTTDSTFPAPDDCAQFHLNKEDSSAGGTGAFYPLNFVLDMHPAPDRCSEGPGFVNRTLMCAGGSYHLNVIADPATGTVALTPGADDGSDLSPEEIAWSKRAKVLDDALQAGFWLAVAGAIDDAASREEKRRADANREISAELEARLNPDLVAEHERNLRRIRELSNFSTDWFAGTDLIYVRGTVSRVDRSSNPRQPIRMHFKESPDDAFIVCVQPGLFGDLSEYVGARVEVRGRVLPSHCGGRVADLEITVPTMIFNLDKEPPADESILPGMQPITPEAPAPHAAGTTATMPNVAPLPKIPSGTSLIITPVHDVDLLHAQNGDSVDAQVAYPVQLRDGTIIPQGAPVALKITRRLMPNQMDYTSVGLVLLNVTVRGQVVPVSTITNFGQVFPTGASSDPRGTLRAGTRVQFYVR